jgi:hypothetical protein
MPKRLEQGLPEPGRAVDDGFGIDAGKPLVNPAPATSRMNRNKLYAL